METIKLAVADRNSLFVNSLVALLNNYSDNHSQIKFDVAAAFSNGKDLQAFALQNEVDLVILGIEIDNYKGYDVVETILHSNPNQKILLMSDILNSYLIRKSMKLGAIGLISKNKSADVFFNVILLNQNGTPYFEYLNSKEMEKKKELTPYEIKLIKFLSKGSTPSQAANLLNYSVRAISNHINILYQKTGTSTKIELALYALKKGYLI